MTMLIMMILKTVLIILIYDDVKNSDIDDNREPQGFCLHPCKKYLVLFNIHTVVAICWLSLPFCTYWKGISDQNFLKCNILLFFILNGACKLSVAWNLCGACKFTVACISNWACKLPEACESTKACKLPGAWTFCGVYRLPEACKLLKTCKFNSNHSSRRTLKFTVYITTQMNIGHQS